MAFMHSLVRWESEGKFGWIAPLELGDQTPGYVSFVVPVQLRQGLFKDYTCEVAYTTKKGARKRDRFKMTRTSATTLLLLIKEHEIWFFVTPIAKDRQRLPYLGAAVHDDFTHPLIEIEPRDLDTMDTLCDESGLFVIGCDPFVHYGGIKSATSNRSIT